MGTKKDAVDQHRTALALISANRAGDVDGVISVLGMVTEDELTEFLIALCDTVHVAFEADPAQGWDAFVARYQAAIDAADAEQ